MAQLRFSELSVLRQAFIRKCHQIGFGQILNLAVDAGDPVFVDDTEVIVDLKLGSRNGPRPELELRDFALASEMVQLFSKLDIIGNGVVRELEVHAGMPRRLRVKVPNQAHE